MFQFDKLTGHYGRLRGRVASKINSVPLVHETLTNLASLSVVKVSLRKATQARRRLEVLAKELPRDQKSVRPYVIAKGKELKTLGLRLKKRIEVRMAGSKSKRAKSKQSPKKQTA